MSGTEWTRHESKTLIIGGGKELEYYEFGAKDRDAHPILFHYGLPGSGYVASLAHGLAKEKGVRVIAPNRPGCGGSTFDPNRKLTDWPGVVVRLADALGIGRVSVVGVSSGGAYACTLGRLCPERVASIVLLSSLAPVGAPRVTLGMRSALREVQLIPALEGSTHINFALTSQFISGYFAGTDVVEAPESGLTREGDPGENPCWFEAGDRNPRTVWFGHFLKAYRPLRSLPNVRLFVKQVKAFRKFVVTQAGPGKADVGAAVALGKCFSTIVYGQLVAENCVAAKVEPSTVSVIFHGLIEDLREESLALAATFPPGSAQRVALAGVVRVPRTDASDLEAVAVSIAARYGA